MTDIETIVRAYGDAWLEKDAAARGGLDHTRPKPVAWLECIRDRPAYNRALEKGGPYELLR